MPIYGFEYLTWIPKTAMWTCEVDKLDARETWRNYWVDFPEQYPYNTALFICNPRFPLFVRTGAL
ncbi:hypothetical protein PHMEG_00027601 [Phytophthora megakarya]|uniref:Uncharacterized protein n=1 Tax=Phytophthora megakarya TaxID=4795 RepID=A0A225V7I3_9STRA|nr:hypothetical protein PHMEG_00027601 [Phytophthora megakarya]